MGHVREGHFLVVEAGAVLPGPGRFLPRARGATFAGFAGATAAGVPRAGDAGARRALASTSLGRGGGGFNGTTRCLARGTAEFGGAGGSFEGTGPSLP